MSIYSEESFTLDLKYDGKDDFVSKEYKKQFDDPGENKTFYFIKIEKMYLSQMSFPIRINYYNKDKNVTFVYVRIRGSGNGYFQFRAFPVKDVKDDKGNIHTATHLLSKANETLASVDSVCLRVNKFISDFALNMRSAISKYQIIYYPMFYVESGSLRCHYVEYMSSTYNDLSDEEKEKQLKEENIYTIGFSYELYDLIGKYFDCNMAKEVTKESNGEELEEYGDKLYYFITPFFNTDLEFDDLVAHRKIDDFFYPEKELYVETVYKPVSEDPQFTEADGNAYNKITIKFRDDKSVMDINKYALFANKATITGNNPTSMHYLRFRLNTSKYFAANSECFLSLTCKLVKLEDNFDNISLFNLNFGQLYSEDEYEQLTFKKLVSFTASNVYVNNENSATMLKDLKDQLLLHFPPLENTLDADNTDSIARMIKNIYYIIRQTQDITPFGPPSEKIAKIDFIN